MRFSYFQKYLKKTVELRKNNSHRAPHDLETTKETTVFNPILTKPYL